MSKFTEDIRGDAATVASGGGVALASGAPSTSAEGDAATVGAGTTAARSDIGSQPVAGTTTAQFFTLVSEVTVAPGRYFMAMSVSNNICTFVNSTAGGTHIRNEFMGVREMYGAFPLPLKIVLSVPLNDRIPVFGMTSRST